MPAIFKNLTGASALLIFSVAVSAANAAIPVPQIWQTETTTGFNAGFAAASGEGYTAVAGQTYSDSCASCGYDALLRIQDASTGVLKWAATFDLNGATDANSAVAISNGVVIVAGYSQGASTSGQVWWVVSAYNLVSGALLWRHVEGDASNGYFSNGMIVSDGLAYVTGAGGGLCGTDATQCNQFTQVYDLQKGTIVATLRADPSGVGNNESLSVAVGDGLMYIGGWMGTASGGTAYLLTAYSLTTHAVVWRDTVASATNDGGILQVRLQGSRLVAIASVNDDWLVRSYDAASGAVQWSQTYSLLGTSTPLVFDTPIQLGVDDDTVVVAGYGSTLPYGTEPYPKSSRDWVVRSYDASTGNLLWSDHSGSPTDVDEAQGGVILLNGRAYVLGFISSGDAQHTVMRAYQERSGHILWDDDTDRPSFPYGADSISLSEADGLLTAVSYVHGTRPITTRPPDSEGDDLLVRTYNIGD